VDKVIREGAVRVGVDLAKRVIQVHAVDRADRVLTRRALARDKFIEWCVRLPAGCIVAMEASSSAHHWARKLTVWLTTITLSCALPHQNCYSC